MVKKIFKNYPNVQPLRPIGCFKKMLLLYVISLIVAWSALSECQPSQIIRTKIWNSRNLPKRSFQGFTMNSLNTTFRKDRLAQLTFHKSSELHLSNYSELAICDNSSLTLNKNSVLQVLESSGFYVQKSSMISMLGDSMVTVRRSLVTVGSMNGMTKVTLFAKAKLNISDGKVDIRSWSQIILMPNSEINLYSDSLKFIATNLNLILGQGSKFSVTNSTTLNDGTFKIGQFCDLQMNNEFVMAEQSLLKFDDNVKFVGHEQSTMAIYNSSISFMKNTKIKLYHESNFILRRSTFSTVRDGLKLEIGHKSTLKMLFSDCILFDDFIIIEGQSINLSGDIEIKNVLKCSKKV